MALAALANIAAAQAAGYTEIVNDRGASYSPAALRFEVTLERQVSGAVGEATILIRAFGQGASQVAAEAIALAGLNGQRLIRYGADSGTTSSSPKGPSTVANPHTRDVS